MFEKEERERARRTRENRAVSRREDRERHGGVREVFRCDCRQLTVSEGGEHAGD